MSKILSVNGNKAMSFLLQTIFEGEFPITQVSGAYQAMHELRNDRQISALIVDVDFQPQQNWELVQHIKSSRLYNIPVIVLTSENNEVLKQNSYSFEVDEIFIKPFNPVDLIMAVKNLAATETLA